MNSVAFTALWLIAACTAQPGAAQAQQPAPGSAARAPFTSTLSNDAPPVFGMAVTEVSRAPGEPLSHVSGGPRDEIYLAVGNIGGTGLFDRHDRLFLQFRDGELAGWKDDWDHNWMWQWRARIIVPPLGES